MRPPRGGKMPRYRQLMAVIQDRIADGTYVASAPLPAEKDLCKEFKISRATVLAAMERLVAMGVVRRQAGSGTFPVATPKQHHGMVIAGYLGMDPVYGRKWRNLLDTFRRQHGIHRITYCGCPDAVRLPLGTSYLDWLSTRMHGDQVPDVCELPGHLVRAFAARGELEQLNRLLPPRMPGLGFGVDHRDPVYSVTWYAHPLGLIVNQRSLRRGRFKVPGRFSSIRTFAKFTRELAQAKLYKRIIGCSEKPATFAGWQAFARAFGARFSKGLHNRLMGIAGWERFLIWFRDIHQDATGELSLEDLSALFVQDEVPIMVSGHLFLKFLRRVDPRGVQEGQYVMHPFPRYRARSSNGLVLTLDLGIRRGLGGAGLEQAKRLFSFLMESPTGRRIILEHWGPCHPGNIRRNAEDPDGALRALVMDASMDFRGLQNGQHLDAVLTTILSGLRHRHIDPGNCLAWVVELLRQQDASDPMQGPVMP